MPDDVFDLPGVDELYGLDLAEFVAARDTLAKSIRADGDREGAPAVKRLTKPSLVAWAINQVARDRPDDVAELVAVGEEVREHQAAAVRGDDPAPLREATARRRTLLKALAGAAVALAGGAHAEEVRTTLEAASLDEDDSASLRHGRLTRTAEATGGFGFGGLQLADDGVEPDSAPPPARGRPKSYGSLKEADAERAEARHAAAERERAALAAEVSRRTEELARADEAVAATEERVRAAAATLTVEEDALATARRAADDARTALDVAGAAALPSSEAEVGRSDE
ncbi:MAG: hypothetical protein WD232_09085 [Acidimicrobiales bacterium]